MNDTSSMNIQASILPAISPEDIQTTIASYDGCLKCVWYIITMGRSFTLHSRTRTLEHRGVRRDPEGLPTDSDYVSRATQEWEAALKYIGREWEMSIAGCILFIPLSVALFQIDTISQHVLARTAVIAAFIFAIAGLALGARLVAHLPQFHKRKCRNAWEKASRSSAELESIEFWSLLALPMALIIWSAILCVMSILIMAWTSQDVNAFSDSCAKAKTVISASFLMVLAMTLAAFMYQCKQITRRLF